MKFLKKILASIILISWIVAFIYELSFMIQAILVVIVIIGGAYLFAWALEQIFPSNDKDFGPR